MKVRLHGFQPLALLRADAITATATPDMHMVCEPARALLREGGYRCTLGGKEVGESSTRDDYLEIPIPPAMLVPDSARVEVRWSETTAVATR